MRRLPFGIAIVAVGGVALAVAAMLPPTDLKASWTSVRYEIPVASPQPDTAPSDFLPTDYPPVAARWQADDEGLQDDPGNRERDAAIERRVADDDAAYGDGYAWAAERGLEDGRSCRRLRGPGREGCADYVASLAPAENEAESF